MNFAVSVKNSLISEIDAMSNTPELFCNNPNKDFTRLRKISFKDMLMFPIVMEGGTLRHELYKYFDYNSNTLSNSAYCQQRNKIKDGTFNTLFHRFNNHYDPKPYKGKYQLMAADGCTFTFTRNPADTDAYYAPDGKSTKGFNQIHTVALYDLESERYVDAIIQPIRKKNEFKALSELIDAYTIRNTSQLIPIFLADRGFYAYNVFAHAIENNAYFLIRIKDQNMERLTGYEVLPELLDNDITRILSRSKNRKKHKHPESEDSYRYICKSVRFDYLSPEDIYDEYTVNLRILRFKISEDSYENVVTNLPRSDFSCEDIKSLYHRRWGIETSFCKLKHVIGTRNFHSKKREYITQEIWARLILYNFCSIITQHVAIKKCKRKFEYQANFTVAFNACHYYIRLHTGEKPPNIESLIAQNILPIRPHRNYARQHRFQIPVSFTYRFS